MTSVISGKLRCYQRREKPKQLPKPIQYILRPNSTVKKKIIIHNKELMKKLETQKPIATSQNTSRTNISKIMNKGKKTTEITNLSRITDKLTKEAYLRSKKKKVASKEFGLNGEFYPEHSKRNEKVQKIRLQPKHQYTVVATTNKRKRRIPLKGVSNLSPPRRVETLWAGAPSPPWESRGLSDEDLAEILTCPSPVWWESDDSSIDEDDEMATLEENSETNFIKTQKHNYFKQFVAKRSKLENVLGNIKYKNNYINEENFTNINDTDYINEESIANIYNNDVKSNIKFENNEIIDKNHFKMDNYDFVREYSRVRQHSLSNISDISLNEEELLKTLENIEIPIKNINHKINNDVVMIGIKNDDEIESKCINKSNKHKIRNKNINQHKNDNLIIKDDENEIQTNYLNKSKLTKNSFKSKKSKLRNIAINEINDIDIPTDLPPLTKNPFNTSPKSTESNTESNVEFDSISDTNIKFLDEYIDDRKTSKESVNVKKYDKGDDGELVTVYQIINNNDCGDLDVEKQIQVNVVNKSPQSNGGRNSEINLFFKTRKSAYRCRSKYKKL